MSLKAFHLVFIALTVGMSLLISGLGWYRYWSGEERETFQLQLGWYGLGAAVYLLFYGRYVWKKTRHIDFL